MPSAGIVQFTNCPWHSSVRSLWSTLRILGKSEAARNEAGHDGWCRPLGSDASVLESGLGGSDGTFVSLLFKDVGV